MSWVSTFPGYSNLMGRAKKVAGQILQTGPTPRHVGVIMDGNRRFAREHKLEVKEGHSFGFDAMAAVLELLYQSGVEHATVYAFSIDNFRRSRQEVDWLMDLAKSKLKQMAQHGELCDQYGIRIRVLGNVSLLPPDVRAALRDTERRTAHNSRAVLNVCFPYTARDEMAHAVRAVVGAAAADPHCKVDQAALERHLYTGEAPPLDLLVRTSGTFRLSDFLLWQAVPSSCAVVFCPKLWPEFTAWDMCLILLRWSFNRYWYGSGSGKGAADAWSDDSDSDSEPDTAETAETAETSGFRAKPSL